MSKKSSAFLLVLVLAGCGHSPADREDLAVAIARTPLPNKEILSGGRFNLLSYARITDPDAPLRVYIEGDGLAFWGTRPSPNPTPTNPVALKLASLDTSPNIIWLARPCQYEGFVSPACTKDYWTQKRFAPEVINTYQDVLDFLKVEYKISSFDLVGFSGGGAVAALLTAQRKDVISLRTIAGNLDHDTINLRHHVPLMPDSLNPKNYALQTAHTPQIHFIGGEDTVVTPDVVKSFKDAAGNTSCMTSVLVPGVSHEKGWEDVWPQLLTQLPKCN